MRLTYAIKYVADMDRAIAFYRDKLGLDLKFQSPFWSEFATGETVLALHPASDDKPAGSESTISANSTSAVRSSESSSPASPRRCTDSTSPECATRMVRTSRSVDRFKSRPSRGFQQTCALRRVNYRLTFGRLVNCPDKPNELQTRNAGVGAGYFKKIMTMASAGARPHCFD